MNLFMDQQFVNVEKYMKMEAPSENKNTEKNKYSIIFVRSQQLLLIIDGYKSNGTIYIHGKKNTAK